MRIVVNIRKSFVDFNLQLSRSNLNFFYQSLIALTPLSSNPNLLVKGCNLK